MNDDQDPILDACLDELLAGRTPPNLSQRILQEWSRRSVPASPLTAPSPEVLLPPVCPAPVSVESSVPRLPGEVVSKTAKRRVRRDRNVVAWTSMALTLGLIVMITTVGKLLQSDRERQSAEQPSPASRAIASPSQPSNRTPPTSPATSVATPSTPSHKLPAVPSSLAQTPESPTESANEGTPVTGSESLSTTNLVSAPNLPAPRSDIEIVNRINTAIRERWVANKLSAPPMVSIQDWHRRAFRVVLGRDPSDAEVLQFKSKSPDARTELIASLTGSEKYLEEFARHWAEFLTDAFLPRDLLESGSRANREGMLHYFRRALLDHRSFDRVATELVTATGTGLPGDPDYNGAANFLLARASGKLEHATSDTARLLLGRNIECQQCHANPGDDRGRQQEFWELNAFFRQMAAVSDAESRVTKLTNVDFLGEDKQDGRNAIVFYELPDGLLKGAFPSFPGQAEFPKSGIVAELNRRELLARCIANSAEFRQAVTNRLLSAVFGTGLAPVNDLDSGDPAYKPLLGELADQFAAHQFDPRRVIAWAVLSEPFAVPEEESKSSFAGLSNRALFHRFRTPGQITRPPVQESLLAATRTLGQPPSNSAAAAKIEESSKKVTKNGKIVLEPPSPPQSLFSAAGSSAADPLAQRVLSNQHLSTGQKADHLFRLVLHRPPQRRELELVERLIQQSGDRPQLAWDAIWGALQESGR
jgi:hypothetical protein